MSQQAPESILRHVSRVPSAAEMSTRVERTHAAVMGAAKELLLEGGPNAVTIDGVVARSGVAKSTVYRHWTTRDELVADVFDHVAPKLASLDPTLDFEAALRTLVGQLITMLADPEWQTVLPALMLLKLHENGIAEVEHRMQEEQLFVCADVLRRGKDEGRIQRDEDEGLLLTLLIGPLLMAALTGTTQLNSTLGDRLIGQFLAALEQVNDAAAATN
jgi:AcrR family transcriptional regulator